MLHTAYNLIPDLYILTKQKYPRHKKWEVFLTYARLMVRQLLLPHQSDGGKMIQEKICGFVVYAFNRGALWFLFREIFIKGQYAFHTNTTTPTIIDCGSNIGLATLFFKWLYPNSSILAFEPDHYAFKALECNIKDNNLSSITLCNSAVGRTAGTITIYTQPENPASLLTSAAEKRRGGTPTTVPLDTVSAHITKNIDFLKIDTEGAEVDIIQDLYTTGKMEYIQEMVIEYHHNINREKSMLSGILIDIERSGFTYQIDAPFSPLMRKHRFQDLLLYCYRNESKQTKELVQESK